jgi:hypothetical protein
MEERAGRTAEYADEWKEKSGRRKAGRKKRRRNAKQIKERCVGANLRVRPITTFMRGVYARCLRGVYARCLCAVFLPNIRGGINGICG